MNKTSFGLWVISLTVLSVGPACANQFAEELVEPCLRSDSAFPKPAVGGPFDYRSPANRPNVRMVEANHFTPQIENLVRGRTGTLAGELSFVLHGFPNHHRALASLSRYGLRENAAQPGNLDYTVDCYFQRALRFRPDDLIVRMLFADYLGKIKRNDDAKLQLDYVRGAAPDNPLTQYNVGLLYFQIGRYKEALAQAHLAMSMGMPRTDLKEKLQAKNLWTDPATAQGGAAGAAPAASGAAASAPGS